MASVKGILSQQNYRLGIQQLEKQPCPDTLYQATFRFQVPVSLHTVYLSRESQEAAAELRLSTNIRSQAGKREIAGGKKKKKHSSLRDKERWANLISCREEKWLQKEVEVMNVLTSPTLRTASDAKRQGQVLE